MWAEKINSLTSITGIKDKATVICAAFQYFQSQYIFKGHRNFFQFG